MNGLFAAAQEAQQVMQSGCAGFRRMVRREEFEELVMECRVIFVNDGVAAPIDQDLRVDHAGERNHLAF